MAIATFELDVRTIRAAADWFHVDGVVEFDRAGIVAIFFGGVEFRMAAVEAVNVRGDVRDGGLDGVEVRVALRAGLIADRGDVDGAAMLGGAGGARPRVFV